MKKIYIIFFLLALTLNLGHLFSQDNTLPNHGLTHRMSESEKLLMKDYSPYFFVTSPPEAPIRNIAEYEPAEAVIIAYDGGFGLPYTVIKDLANTGDVIIACPSSSQSTALSLLNSNGVNTSVCSFLTTPLDSWWTRDYSGWFIADSSDHVAVVDFEYNRPRPNDDAVTALEATLLGVDYYCMDLVHTGGNWMCDGYNNAISTVLVEEENTSMTTAQIQQEVLDFLGIDNYMIRPDAQGAYIEHIDCWAKLLAPDKILVDSVPSTDAQYSDYEAAAAYFASTNCAYGYPYKVYRPLIAGSAETSTAEPYSNSFIFNNRVFVPIKGGSSAPHDTAALQCYRKAMPGYTVKGYTSSGSQVWYGTDALHCRTHEIADREMLYIEHSPLYGLVTGTPDYGLTAKVVSYGDFAISANYPKVVYKVGKNGIWDSVALSSQGNHQYIGAIPAKTPGDTIYYYITAKDVNGKRAYHALMGKKDPHWFIVDGSVEVPEVVTDPQLSFFSYPNPSMGNFVVFLKANYTDNATLNIKNVTGSLVYSEDIEISKGNSMKKLNLEDLTSGIYFLELKTGSSVVTNKLIIE